MKESPLNPSIHVGLGAQPSLSPTKLSPSLLTCRPFLDRTVSLSRAMILQKERMTDNSEQTFKPHETVYLLSVPDPLRGQRVPFTTIRFRQRTETKIATNESSVKHRPQKKNTTTPRGQVTLRGTSGSRVNISIRLKTCNIK